MKYCNKCKEEKELSDFNKNKSAKDGLQHHCRECHRSVANKYAGLARQYVRDNHLPGRSEGDTALSIAVEAMDVMDYLEWIYTWTEHDPETDCFLWTGHVAENGYGNYNVPLPTTPGSNYPIRPHRLSYALANGMDALFAYEHDLMTIDHMCGVRSCVNPLHLQMLTLQENLALAGQERVGKKFSDLKTLARSNA